MMQCVEETAVIHHVALWDKAPNTLISRVSAYKEKVGEEGEEEGRGGIRAHGCLMVIPRLSPTALPGHNM